MNEAVISADAVLAAIRSGDLQVPMPQALSLQSGDTLYCEQLLRLMPGKRAVFKARYRDQAVLAKIFLDSAARQIGREITGYERLSAAQQPTPKLIDRATYAGATALLFEFIGDAQPLFREDTAPRPPELKRLLDRLQSMYSNGIYHDDLHWGNFLRQGETALVIDAGAVLGEPSRTLDAAQIIDNLGLLIAQFRRCDQDLVQHAVLTHALCQQFQLTTDSLTEAAENHWQRRKQTLLQKCFRSTTATCYVNVFDRSYAYRRAYAGPDLAAFLRDPDHIMARGQALKLGNSATVAKLTLDGRGVVIKRYNMKDSWHWLRRCLRPSRAHTNWCNAHWLELLGLHTPTPIAFFEMRCGWLRRRAYYVREFIDGEVLANALSERDPSPAELSELEKYFSVAARDHLIHGDMKATNFLLHDEKLIVLDLDAMREESSARWKPLYLADFMRFKRNWKQEMGWLTQLQALVTRLLA